MSATGTAIRPFVVKDMVSMIMQKKRLSFVDASNYLYSSDLYAKILDEETKMWYLSTHSLYDILEEEKRQKRHQQLSDKLLMFRSYCVESILIIGSKILSIQCLCLAITVSLRFWTIHSRCSTPKILLIS